MIYDADILCEISDALEYKGIECPISLLALANQRENLEELLVCIGQETLLQTQYKYTVSKSGKIVIIGESAVKEKDVFGIAKSLGIDKDRIEFVGDYDKTKNYNFGKLQWQPNYSLVIMGPTPHKTTGTGDSRRPYSYRLQNDGYPEVLPLSFHEPMSRTAIKNALVEALNKELILQDFAVAGLAVKIA